MFELHWTAFLNVTTKQKADKLIGRFEEKIHARVIIEECQPYWKDPKLYQAVFKTLLCSVSIEKAVFEALTLSSRISHSWTINCPQKYADGQWTFSGSAGEKNISVVGIKSLDFEVSGYESDSASS